MGNVIGHIGPMYPGTKVEATGGSRPIRTTVKLPSMSKDNFSHKASIRHTRLIDEPADYEDMAGGHKNERD